MTLPMSSASPRRPLARRRLVTRPRRGDRAADRRGRALPDRHSRLQLAPVEALSDLFGRATANPDAASVVALGKRDEQDRVAGFDEQPARDLGTLR
jgi:hypothetical protein